MNTALAKKLIADSGVKDYQDIFSSATILPADEKKMVVMGKRSSGKAFLLSQILGTDQLPEFSIHIPIVISMKLFPLPTDLSISKLAEANAVKNCSLPNSYIWSKLGSSPVKLTDFVDFALLDNKNQTLAGIFFRPTSFKGSLVSQHAQIILAPDIDSASPRVINELADIADVIILVGDPKDFIDGTFGILKDITNIKESRHKTVIAVIIHSEKSNLYHFPLTKTDDIKQKESSQKNTASGVYSMLRASSTQEGIKKALRDGIVDGAKQIIAELQNDFIQIFDKFPIHSAIFLPTNEKESADELQEDPELIQSVSSFQLSELIDKISSGISQNLPTQLPFVNWDYFFRKCEDVCLDINTPMWESCSVEEVRIHALSLIYNAQLKSFKNKVDSLFRDYEYRLDEITDTTWIALQSIVIDFLKASSALLSNKEKAQKALQSQTVNLLPRLSVADMSFRVKTKFGIEQKPILAKIIAIVEELKSIPKGQLEQTINARLKTLFAKDTLIAEILAEAPCKLQHNRLNQQADDNKKRKEDIIRELNMVISYADAVDGRVFIETLLEFIKAINLFTPQEIVR